MTARLRLGVSAVVLLSALALLQLRSAGEAVPIRQSLDTFPSRVGTWEGREATILEPDVLDILKLKDYVMRRYANADGRSILLYIGYWDTQRRGAQIHSPKNCLPGAGWEPLEASIVTIPLLAPSPPIRVNRYLVQKDTEQQLVFYWYQAQGRATAGEIEARIQLMKNSLFRNRTDGALVRVSSPIVNGVRDTSARLTGFIQAMYPLLTQYLPD